MKVSKDNWVDESEDEDCIMDYQEEKEKYQEKRENERKLRDDSEKNRKEGRENKWKKTVLIIRREKKASRKENMERYINEKIGYREMKIVMLMMD